MRTTAQRLDRILFETSRAAEHFSVTEVQAQTGQPVDRCGDMVLLRAAEPKAVPAALAGPSRRQHDAEGAGTMERLHVGDHGMDGYAVRRSAAIMATAADGVHVWEAKESRGRHAGAPADAPAAVTLED